MGSLYLEIVSPNGENLGATPINRACELLDGSYGLIEFCDGDTDIVADIEFGLVSQLRDACEPVSSSDFDPQVGTKVTYRGFFAEVVAE